MSLVMWGCIYATCVDIVLVLNIKLTAFIIDVDSRKTRNKFQDWWMVETKVIGNQRPELLPERKATSYTIHHWTQMAIANWQAVKPCSYPPSTTKLIWHKSCMINGQDFTWFDLAICESSMAMRLWSSVGECILHLASILYCKAQLNLLSFNTI